MEATVSGAAQSKEQMLDKAHWAIEKYGQFGPSYRRNIDFLAREVVRRLGAGHDIKFVKHDSFALWKAIMDETRGQNK